MDLAKQLIESDIFEAVGLGNLADDQKQALMQQMSDSVNRGILLRVSEQLEGSDRDQWLALIDAGKDAEASDFVASKGIDLNKLVIEESLNLKAQMIEIANQLKQG